MLLTLAFALLTPPLVDNLATPAPGTPIRIWMKGTVYQPGDPVRVQVETGRAGYLLVLHYTPESQLEVLFPVSPDDDTFVPGDRRFEIRPPGQSASFTAGEGGMGMIYTALAEEPFRFDEFRLGDQWNNAALTIPRDTQDPEADLTVLVQRMASVKGFDYDIQEYSVHGEIVMEEGVTPPRWWSPTYVYVENYPGPGCFNCGYYSPAGITIGVGLGWSWGYSPYYWGWPYGYYGYYGHGYGYYPGYGYPYYPYYPYYRPPYSYPGDRVVNGPRLIGRPRGYEVRPPIRPESRGVGRAIPGGTVGREGGAPAAGPARRARPASRGEARPIRPGDGGSSPATGGSAGGRPSGGGSGGSAGGRPSGGSPGGGRPAPPARARPRSGDRPASESRVASGPNIETSRPEARGSSNWVRIDDPPRARSGDLGRAVRPETGRTIRIDQPVRPAPEATARARGSNRGVRLGEALNQARSAQRSFTPRPAAQPSVRPQPGSPPRAVSRPASPSSAPRAAPSSGARSGSSGARPSGGGGSRARPRP